ARPAPGSRYNKRSIASWYTQPFRAVWRRPPRSVPYYKEKAAAAQGARSGSRNSTRCTRGNSRARLPQRYFTRSLQILPVFYTDPPDFAEVLRRLYAAMVDSRGPVALQYTCARRTGPRGGEVW